jgi:hypothetical protein
MINNWKQFNENLFNYFNKDKKDERIKKNLFQILISQFKILIFI